MRSFHRRSNLVSISVFSFAWGLCVLFLALPFTASAAGVTYQTTRVGPASYATNGITSPITVNVAPAGGVPRYQQIVPVAKAPTIGKLGRAAVRGGGVGIAVYGIVEGLGYLIDQASGQISKEQTIYGNPTGSRQLGSNQATKSAVPLSDLSPIYEFCSGASYCSIYAGTPNVSANARRWNCSNSNFPIGYSTNDPTGPIPSTNAYCYSADSTIPETTQIVPVSQSDLDYIDSGINSGLSLSQKGSLVAGALALASPRGDLDTSQYPLNPLTSSNSQIQQLYNDWPELRSALQLMLNAELAAVIATLDPSQQPSPDEQVIVDEGTTSPPMDPPVDFELPPFCEWATFICEPFVSDAQPEVPLLDLEAPNYDSGLPSSAVCPTPYQIVTGFGTWEITFDFACQMASAIRTPLLAIAYLMSAFIVVGVRK